MKRIKKILGGVFVLVLGAGLVFFGVKEYRTSKRLVKEGTSVEAQVTDKDISRGRKGRKTYYLEVAYKAGGQDYEKRLKVSSSEYDAASVGSSVPVRYLPNDPQTCQIGDKANVPWMYLAGGVFLALCGVGSCANGVSSDEESSTETAADGSTTTEGSNVASNDAADDEDDDDEELAA